MFIEKYELDDLKKFEAILGSLLEANCENLEEVKELFNYYSDNQGKTMDY